MHSHLLLFRFVHMHCHIVFSVICILISQCIFFIQWQRYTNAIYTPFLVKDVLRAFRVYVKAHMRAHMCNVVNLLLCDLNLLIGCSWISIRIQCYWLIYWTIKHFQIFESTNEPIAFLNSFLKTPTWPE